MAEVASDVVEQILVRSEAIDLIRYKSVCKSWHSLISSPTFVKAQLNHSYNNDRNNRQLRNRRICMGKVVDHAKAWQWDQRSLRVAGSCNGLICVSPEVDEPPEVDEIVLINPLTRKVKILPTPPYSPEIPVNVCCGFGYDSSADDYKVIAGFMKTDGQKWTLFYVFTLKSNTWSVIGEIEYGTDGVLCGGALHWFMDSDAKQKVIISLDLTTHEFKEPPQPKFDVNDDHKLGIIDECLCIYPSGSRLFEESEKMTNVFSVTDGKKVSGGYLIFANIFVKSLVSPHYNYERQKGKNIDEEQDTNGKVQSKMSMY
ncbi:F-box/kelch-repeat protein At2g43270-like [Bidens hawaiensis]|uniref:F-box/kelch-repeat protein At2g43270-like n=1 Tax=Bidens hawaiensis TaxID=980011 RepID=UPI00404A3288